MSESGRVLGATITNIITDLIVLALPIPTLWKLHLPRRERIILVTLMSLGLMYVSFIHIEVPMPLTDI